MNQLPETLATLESDIHACRRCPRLVAWRELVAAEKRAAFADWDYWGKPVGGFGDPDARIAVLGLAPAAHGANRTGRIFTGDRSGDFLFASMHRCGLANQPQSISRDDGLTLRGVWVTAAVRCAPPANKPTIEERDNCAPWLARELELLPGVKVVICLGAFAWDAALRFFGSPRPKPKFAHGAQVRLEVPAHAGADAGDAGAAAGNGAGSRVVTLLGSYHVSQQNTFTGKLTEEMIDGVFSDSIELARTKS